MSTHGLGQSLGLLDSRPDIPNAQGFIEGVRHEESAVVRDLQRADRILVSLDHLLNLIGRNVVAFDFVIDSPKIDLIPIEAETDTG